MSDNRPTASGRHALIARAARTGAAGFGLVAVIAAGSLVAPTAANAADATPEFPVWSYNETNTDPSAGAANRLTWTLADYDDSSWKTGTGAFGAKNGSPTPSLGSGFPVTTVLTQYIAGTTTDIPTYHFRTTFDIDAEDLEEYEAVDLGVLYDDGAQVFVNGTKVAGLSDERVEAAPEAERNLMYAGAGQSDPISATVRIPADVLVDGENTLAVALYQDRASSSDIYFNVTSYTPVAAPGDPGDDPVAVSDVILGIGADESQRTLNWYADADVPQEAQLAEAPIDGSTEFPEDDATVVAATGAVTTSSQYSRKATLTGLSPATAYVYRVGSDATGWSDTLSFRTQEFEGDFGFLFFGDPQIGASGNVANDQAGWEDTLDVAQATYPDAEMIFSAGDQVEHAGNETEYDAFLAPDQLREIPTVVTNGNHDVGSKAYEQHYNVPNNDPTAGAGSSTSSGGDYWFIYKDVLFVNINSNSRDYASHNAFMEQVVAEHGDEATWKVLAFHHSIYSVASHTNDGDILDRRAQMPTEISDLGFDVVLQGHDHSYTRSYLIKDGALADATEVAGQATVTAEPGEVLYVTANSASGSKYYSVQAPNAWFASVINQERVRNYSYVDVTDGAITITTMRSQANGTDLPVNSVVDEVTLKKADHEKPEITLPDTDSVTLGSDFDALAGVSATDAVDGDLTSAIEVDGTVDTGIPGLYELTYSVTDAAGNTATASRSVRVEVGVFATAATTITGTPEVGGTLTAATGDWTPTPTAFAYLWSADGERIAGASGRTLELTGDLVGAEIAVTVYAVRDGFLPAATTSTSVTVVEGTLTVGTPTVSGAAKPGATLTAVPGTWTEGTAFTYRWLAGGKVVNGATGRTFKVPNALGGQKIAVQVTGTRVGYAPAWKTSASVTIARGTITGATPKITGTAKVGKTLKVTRGSWTGATTFRYQWYADGAAISGATGTSYTVSSSRAGDRITVKVTGSATGYTTLTKTSAQTSKVAK